jgi:hypothetical protein
VSNNEVYRICVGVKHKEIGRKLFNNTGWGKVQGNVVKGGVH